MQIFNTHLNTSNEELTIHTNMHWEEFDIVNSNCRPVVLTDAAQYYVHRFVDNLNVDKATKSKAVKFLMCLLL